MNLMTKALIYGIAAICVGVFCSVGNLLVLGTEPPPKENRQPPRMRSSKEIMSRPSHKKMVEKLKDEGRYYHPNTVKELQDRAEKGDEWAVRELPWPKEHRLHKMGRPYFRNDKPHPEGLFPHSGL